MTRGDFTFKHFSIQQSDCAQKVCTEACILGAYVAETLRADTMLDVGSGTGLLSLMYAQKHPSSQVTAVEIDPRCHQQSLTNLKSADFGHHIKAQQDDIRTLESPERYQLILSNPPFYTSSLHSADRATTMAKHDITLRAEDWHRILERHSTPQTTIALLLSTEQILSKYQSVLAAQGFIPQKILHIRDTQDAKPGTQICIFRHESGRTEVEDFIIKNNDGSYTAEMRELLKDYYLYL